MKNVFKLLLFAWMALPSAIFAMDNASGENPIAQILKRRAAISAPSSEENSMESSLVVTPRHVEPIITDEALEKLKELENQQNNGTPAQIPEKIQAPKKRELGRGLSLQDAIKSVKTNQLAKAPEIKKVEEKELPALFKGMSLRASQFQNQPNSNNSDEENNNASNEKEALPAIPATLNSELEKINALALQYENASLPDTPPVASIRPLPAPPVGANPGLPARLAMPGKPRDDAPLIQEMPEPIDNAPALPKREDLTPDQQDATDFTQIREPESRGVREELPIRQARPVPLNVPRRPEPAKAPRRPVPAAPRKPTAQPVDTNPGLPARLAMPGKPRQVPSRPSITINTQKFPTANILASVGLFALFTWLDSSSFQKKLAHVRYPALAQEFRTFGKQIAAANVAQKLLPGRKANSAAFATAFSALHAGEAGLKRLYIKLIAPTKSGKKITAAYNKIPENKRKLVDQASTGASWLLKTLLARAVTS